MSRNIEKDGAPAQDAADVANKATRRGFLVGAGAVAGIAGAAAVALKTHAGPAADAVAPVAAEQPAQARGYHETAHIRRYYETTKV